MHVLYYTPRGSQRLLRNVFHIKYVLRLSLITINLVFHVNQRLFPTPFITQFIGNN